MEIMIPPYTDLLWPTLEAVRALGGSGSIEEIVERVVHDGNFSEEQQEVLHGDGPRTEVEYRLAWARTYLKGMGLLVNSQRGVWSLTAPGREAAAADIPALHRAYSTAVRDARRLKQAKGQSDDVTDDDEEASAPDWRELLLEAVMSMAPDGFERLAQRLLREAGFVSATVTGRSGDGGIDGLGVYRLSLVSFPVFFQCKRYRGSVGSPAVRDFRGAMAGRGDKGLLITTGTFSAKQRPRRHAMGRRRST